MAQHNFVRQLFVLKLLYKRMRHQVAEWSRDSFKEIATKDPWIQPSPRIIVYRIIDRPFKVVRVDIGRSVT